MALVEIPSKLPHRNSQGKVTGPGNILIPSYPVRTVTFSGVGTHVIAPSLVPVDNLAPEIQAKITLD